MAFLQPSFTLNTYYTTYNYKTTTFKNNATAVSNAITTITNIKTEPFSNEEIKPTKSLSYAFDGSPTLRTEVFDTEYTYFNTILDGDQPLVVSSTHTISNTLVGNNFAELEPSEVFPTTNTYLKTVELTKTITDGTDRHIVSTTDVVTRVVVTDKPTRKSTTALTTTTNVTKTYFVTYTYFSTFVDGDKTKVKSDVSVSSDVAVEKFYIKPKKTDSKTLEKVTRTEDPGLEATALNFPFNILATKTYMTTFTYYTTLLHGTNSEVKINSRTKIKEKVVAETIPQQEFNTNYLIKLNSSLQKISGSLVGTATLKGGETILVTAYKNPSLKHSYQKYEIKPTKTIFEGPLNTERNQIDATQKASSKKDAGEKTSSSTANSKITLIKSSKTANNQPIAEPLIADEEEESSILMTPVATIAPTTSHTVGQSNPTKAQSFHEKATVSSAGVQNDVERETDSPASLAEPSENKPEQKPKPVNQTNPGGLLNLKVLEPVFNAMAELIHNKISKNVDVMSRRNDTVANNNNQVTASGNANPLLKFVNKFTAPTTMATTELKTKHNSPRTPVYIPVGSFGQDSAVSQNQNRRVLIENPQDNWYEKWKNIHAKNYNKVRTRDNSIAILEGGIPISPGQVITTNSDVIIGRPGESGPRPPTFALKNDIPIDMKPPPIPPAAILPTDGDHYVGQHSTNKGVNYHFAKDDLNKKPPLPIPPPKKHIHEGPNFKIPRPRPSERFKNGPPLKNVHSNKNTKYDMETMDLNPPPVPPPPIRPHDIHRPVSVNHKPKPEPVFDSPQNNRPIAIQLGESQNFENYVNPSEIDPSILSLPALPSLNQIHHGSIPLINVPTPNVDVANPESVILIPGLGDLSDPNLVDRSTGHPFLVNIQPSQVANIVIPHGSSTALIVSGGKQHSLKGEVIDDPSPHPEPETVGFVGAEPVLKIENDDITPAPYNEIIPAETAEVSHTASHLNGLPLAGHLVKNPNFHRDQNSHFTQHYLSQFKNFTLASHQESGSSGKHHQLINQNHQDGGKLFVYQSHDSNGRDDLLSSQNINFKTQNSVAEHGEGQGVKNYRKEPFPNVYSNVKGSSESQKIYGYKQVQSNHGQKYPMGSDGLFTDHTRFNQGQILESSGGRIVAPPPEHLPGKPDINQLHENHSPDKQQSGLINHHLHHHHHHHHHRHQSGIVQDVSFPHGQSNSDKQKEVNPLKNILLNSNNQDSIPYDSQVGLKYSKNQNPVQRPADEFSEDLSPPPLPHRPVFVSNHQSSGSQKIPQKYRPHSNQPAIPTPLEFMIPPPETPGRVKLKPEPHSRPVIPIGALAPLQNFAKPRPEDMVIIPNKNRPGFVDSSFANNNNRPMPPIQNSYYLDLESSDTNTPLKTDDGQEIQESVSQPFFPGKVSSRPIHLHENSSNRFSNHHQNIKPLKPQATEEITQNYTLNVNVRKPDGVDSTGLTKPQIKKPGSDVLTNVSSEWSNNNRNPLGNKTVEAQVSNSGSGLFKHPSTHINVDSNSAQLYGLGTNKVQGVNYRQEYYDVANRKKPSGLLNHQGSSFESFKIQTGIKGSDSINSGSGKIPSPFAISRDNVSSVKITPLKPSMHASGFVTRRPPSSNANQNEFYVIGASQGQTAYATQNNGNKVEKDSSEYSSTQINGFLGTKNNTIDLTSKSNETEKEISGSPSHSNASGNRQPGKPPGRYGPPNHSNHVYRPGPQTIQNFKNFTRPLPGVGGQNGRPIKNSPASASGGSDRNKISVAYPTIINVPAYSIESNSHSRPFLSFDSIGQDSVEIKQPSGFKVSNSKNETNKVFSSSGSKEKPQLIANDIRLGSSESNRNKASTASGSPTSAFATKNETYHGNKTKNYYNSKPIFEVTNLHNNYNSVANEADSWFASTFNNYNYNESTASNKHPSAGSYQNTSSVLNPLVPNTSQVEMTLLTPPKPVNTGPGLEEVMGLSPPPLTPPRRPQRPQRPQRPLRPKPEYEFEIPSTTKPGHTPIAIENDFPPVRSPEFNKKPFKPQDIFPPRLPDNFVHHLPDYSGRLPPKTRLPEKPVTSLPIDLPTTDAVDKPARVTSSYVDDPFAAGTDINGHSKPIREEGVSSIKRQSSSITTSIKTKAVISTKSSTAYQEKSRDGARPESTSQQNKQSITKSLNRDDISPTPTVNVPIMKTHHTKMSSLVTPTITQPYETWQDADLIIGSETEFNQNQFSNRVTPTIKKVGQNYQTITTLISTGSTTIFGDLYLPKVSQAPENKFRTTAASGEKQNSVGKENNPKTLIAPAPTITPTRTTTLTVTTTMTTVLHSLGHKPLTKTIVFTKTLISTVFNKITETKTLVRPTTATFIQTHTIETTKTALVVPTAFYPTQTNHKPSGTLKPEIFFADPHAADTMTISVSSSLNKNNNREPVPSPGSGPLDQTDQESIMVVVSNEQSQEGGLNNNRIRVGDENDDDDDDEAKVFVGGVLGANSREEFQESNSGDECFPTCKAIRNESCQKLKGVMKCVCRPGFARLFPDRPCRRK